MENKLYVLYCSVVRLLVCFLNANASEHWLLYFTKLASTQRLAYANAIHCFRTVSREPEILLKPQDLNLLVRQTRQDSQAASAAWSNARYYWGGHFIGSLDAKGSDFKSNLGGILNCRAASCGSRAPKYIERCIGRVAVLSLDWWGYSTHLVIQLNVAYVAAACLIPVKQLHGTLQQKAHLHVLVSGNPEEALVLYQPRFGSYTVQSGWQPSRIRQRKELMPCCRKFLP
jgi:hypothetical protein